MVVRAEAISVSAKVSNIIHHYFLFHLIIVTGTYSRKSICFSSSPALAPRSLRLEKLVSRRLQPPQTVHSLQVTLDTKRRRNRQRRTQHLCLLARRKVSSTGLSVASPTSRTNCLSNVYSGCYVDISMRHEVSLAVYLAVFLYFHSTEPDVRVPTCD